VYGSDPKNRDLWIEEWTYASRDYRLTVWFHSPKGAPEGLDDAFMTDERSSDSPSDADEILVALRASCGPHALALPHVVPIARGRSTLPLWPPQPRPAKRHARLETRATRSRSP
jgi:hypothetical protein